MNQIIHILRKDLRCFWPEILVSLASLAAYTWHEPVMWQPSSKNIPQLLLTQVLALLILLSWFLLVLRLIHEEPLIGQRQFWVTRPYGWKQLLAAKVLLVLIVVNLPMLACQTWLLKRAGFAAGGHVSLLLSMQAMWLAARFLPIAVLAVLTRSLAQAGIALLAMLLGSVVVMQVMVAGMIGVPAGMDYGPSLWDSLGATLLLSAACAVVVWQYARRRAAWALVFLAAGVLAFVACRSVTNERGLIERRFPPSGASAAARMTLVPAQPAQNENDGDDSNTKWIALGLPVEVAGLAPDVIVKVTGGLLSVEAPGENRWETEWQAESGLLLPTQRSDSIRIVVPRAVYGRMRKKPVKVRVALAAEFYRVSKSMDIVAPEKEFFVPEAGWCSVGRRGSSVWMSVECRAPARWPSVVLAKTVVSASTCHLADDPWKTLAPGTAAYGWSNASDSVSDISPIRMQALMMTAKPQGRSQELFLPVCAGTPVTFSFPELTHRGRLEIEASGIMLEDFRLPAYSQGEDSMVGFSINF